MEEKTKFSVVMGPHSEAKQLAARRLRRRMTPAETQLWYHLRGNRLDGLHFRRQQVVDGFIADFYCHTVGLIIELDGPIHERQTDYDQVRDGILRQRHLRILCLTNSQILTSRPAALAQIRAIVHKR